MWKSVKQPFTLIRQYLRCKSRHGGRKHKSNPNHRRQATASESPDLTPFYKGGRWGISSSIFFKKTEMKSKWSFPPGGCPCDQVTNLKHGSPTTHSITHAHTQHLGFRFPREMATHRPLSVSTLTPAPTHRRGFLSVLSRLCG